jgi:hypothetical protein
MHKLLLLGLSFLCTIPLQAQIIYEYVFHERHGNIQAIDVNENNILAAAGSTKSCPEGFVAYFNPEGRLFWKKPLREYLSPATDVFFDREGNIVVAGTKSEADDYGVPTDGIYLLKLDIIGNTIFYKRFQSGFYLFEKVHAVQLPDSNYLAGVRNRLFWARANGDSLQTRELPLERIIDITVTGDSTFLVLGKNRVLSLNLKGDLLAELEAEEDFVAACSKRDTTWLLGSQHVWVITDDFSTSRLFPLQDIPGPDGIIPKQNREGVLIWSNDRPGHTFLNFSEGFWSVPEIDPVIGSNLSDVKNVGENYFFAGSALWEDMPRGDAMYGAFVSATAENMYRTPTITRDLGIESVSVQLTSPLDTFDRIMMADTLFAVGVGGLFEGSIEIINRSAFNVKEFVLSSSQQGSFNCAEGRAFYGIIDSIDMEPFEIKKINVRFRDFTYFYTSNGSSLERCFFVAAPNHLFDQYYSNNTVCSTILTSTRNLKLPETAVSVFPNPAAGQIHIRTEGRLPIESMELFNLAGQLQFTLTEINFDQGVLARGNLPAGLYWLRVQTKEGIAVKKVLFQ